MRSHWIGVDRGQNVAVVAATPDGPVVFWKARQIRHVRRVFARRRQMLQAKGKYRAVKKLENKERRIVTHINHVMSKLPWPSAARQESALRTSRAFGLPRGSEKTPSRMRGITQLLCTTRPSLLAWRWMRYRWAINQRQKRVQAVRTQGARRCQCGAEYPGLVWAVLPAGSSCSSGQAA